MLYLLKMSRCYITRLILSEWFGDNFGHIGMIDLCTVVNAWGTPAFNDIVKIELEQMGVEQLPLQQALSFSSIALDTNIKALPLSCVETDNSIIVKVSIFYTGLISGCHCADDPSPLDEQNEYCEIQLAIQKTSGDTMISLLAD